MSASTVIRQTAKRLRTLGYTLGAKGDGSMAKDAEALEQAARDYDEAIAALTPWGHPGHVCTCDEAYVVRRLRDPDCFYHEWSDEIEAARAVLAKETANP